MHRAPVTSPSLLAALWLLGALLLGCGKAEGTSLPYSEPSHPDGPTDVVPTDPWHSGQRLHARVITDGAGASVFRVWYDTQLDMDCAFQPTSDGAIRCMPLSENRIPIVGSLFSDSTCEHRASYSYTAEVPEYVFEERVPEGYFDQPARCSADPTVGPVLTPFRVVGQLALPIFEQTMAGCNVLPLDSPDVVVFDLAPAALDGFVAATRHDTSGTIGAAWLEAEDGSHEVMHLTLEGGEVCNAVPSLDDRGLCLPVSAAAVQPWGGFSDPGCSTPALFTEAQLCADTSLAYGMSQLCGFGLALDLSFYEIREQSTQLYDYAPADQQGNLACFATDEKGFVVSPEWAVDASKLPQVAVVSRGKGRLNARFGTSDGGVAARNAATGQMVALSGEFFDTQLNVPCTPADTAEGLRCVPDGAGIAHVQVDERILPYYADAECTQPALLVSDDCLAPEVVVVSEYTPSGDAVRAWTVLQSTADPSVPSVFVRADKQGGGGCTQDLNAESEGFSTQPAIEIPVGQLAALASELE